MAIQDSGRLPTLCLLVDVRRGLALALLDTARELRDESRAVQAQARLAYARSEQLLEASRRTPAHCRRRS